VSIFASVLPVPGIQEDEVKQMPAFKVKIIHCWLEKGPDGRAIPQYKDTKETKEIAAVNVDEARRRVRKMLREKGLDIRCISHAVDGSIRASVWRDGKPQTVPDKNLVWKRPPSSSPRRL
jgi:hypothetical protein